MGRGRRQRWIGAAACTAGIAAAAVPIVADAAAAAPTAVTVTTTADVLDAGDGLTSLREAVAQANTTPGDAEIVLADATYALSICGPGGDGPAANDAGDLNLARADALGPAVTITGNGATVVQTCTGVAHLHDDRTAAGSSLTITDATFTGATDVLTDAVSIGTAAALTLDGVTVADNSAGSPWHWASDDPGPAAVVSTGGPALTITSSTVSGTIFGGGILDHATSGSLIVQDATITGNTGIGEAGGIAALGRHLTITDSTIADNHPPEVQVPDGPVTAFDRLELDEDDLARAGGVYAPSATAERVLIERNAGYDTGGIEASAIALTDAHVRRNIGTITGGVTAGPGSSVVRTTMEENIGELVGGGLRADTWCTDTCPSTVTVSDSLVRANASVYGGGAATVTQRTGGTVTFPPGDTLVLHQVSIVDNVAETGNSLMVAGGTTAVVESVTMTGGHPLDDAEGTPADIGEVYIVPTSAPILTVTDTVVAPGGPHAACALTAGVVTSGGGNVVSDGTCGLDQASDLSGVDDVGLGPLADNGGPTLTRLPAPDSPLLDRGVGTCGPADQRGLPRPQGPACDTGAVERPLGGFHPMPPTRVLDSRDGTGGWSTPLGAGEVRPLTIAGLPDDTAAVVANITVTDTTAASHLSTGPDPATIAGVSTLNWRAGQTVANSATVPVGPGDTIAVRNNSGTVHVVIDLVGTYDDGALGCPCGDGATMTTPTRIVDTRDGTGGWSTPFGPGTARTIATGLGPGARTAIVNLTAVAPSADTHLTAWPAGPLPATSNLNLPAGDTRANLAIVPLAPDGTFRLRNNSGTTHVVVDLIGSFGDGGWRFRPIAPTRTLDTRPTGFGAFPILVPMPTLPTGTRAAVTNLTGIFPTAATHLTMSAGTITGPTSNLNLPAGDVRANQVITRIDPDAPAALLANAAGTTNAAVDLVGYLG